MAVASTNVCKKGDSRNCLLLSFKDAKSQRRKVSETCQQYLRNKQYIVDASAPSRDVSLFPKYKHTMKRLFFVRNEKVASM